MKMEKRKGRAGKKGDNANDIENQIAESKRHIEGTSGAELVEEKIPLLNSPANNNEVTYSAAAEECLESDSGEGEEDEDEEKGFKFSTLIDLYALFVFTLLLLVLLVCSLTLKQLQNLVLWDFKLWKWCVLALAICCGRIATYPLFDVFFIPLARCGLRSYSFFYYLYGMRVGLIALFWLGLNFQVWLFLYFTDDPTGKPTWTSFIVNRTLACAKFITILWMLKSLLVLVLAASFQPKRFFDPIQESIFHQYIIQALSGPPLRDQNEQFQRGENGIVDANQKCVIDVRLFKKIKIHKITLWDMKELMDVARSTKLSFFSSQQRYKEIKSDLQAEQAAGEIFNKVANRACGGYISKKDLERFLTDENVALLLTKFEGAGETEKIQESEFKEWVVNVYNKRKALSRFIKQSKSATEELDRLLIGITIVVSSILWLISMELLKPEVLAFIISQLVLVAFMFGNTVKNIFESVIFLYVMHPFDVGDRCVVDGVEMVVEEIHILTTTFVRYDNEKVLYPNSVLATKPINNLYRSTGDMKDFVEFVIDPFTSIGTIEALKSKIQDYLNSKRKLWKPKHKVVVKEMEDANKIRMVLHVTHAINFRKYEEKSSRRSQLVLQLMQIFEELGISKSHVLSQPRPSSAESAAPQRAN